MRGNGFKSERSSTTMPNIILMLIVTVHGRQRLKIVMINDMILFARSLAKEFPNAKGNKITEQYRHKSHMPQNIRGHHL